MAIPFLACMALVAGLYHLPPRVLPAIQAVEGGRAGLVSLNTDGSEDLGLMQVNTRWLTPLARYSGRDVAVVRENLVTRPCYSIAAAGWILRIYLNEARGNLMQAVGDYHSHTRPLNAAYQVQVVQSAWSLFGPKLNAGRMLPSARRVQASR